jgi:hypothetical protein
MMGSAKSLAVMLNVFCKKTDANVNNALIQNFAL